MFMFADLLLSRVISRISLGGPDLMDLIWWVTVMWRIAAFCVCSIVEVRPVFQATIPHLLSMK